MRDGSGKRLYISDPYESKRQPTPPNGGDESRSAVSGTAGEKGEVRSALSDARGAEPRFLEEDGALSCPLAELAAELIRSLEQSRRGLRRLRAAALQCRSCPKANSCPSMAAFNAAIDAAINELWEEWTEQGIGK